MDMKKAKRLFIILLFLYSLLVLYQAMQIVYTFSIFATEDAEWTKDNTLFFGGS